MIRSVCLRCEYKPSCSAGRNQPDDCVVITGCSQFAQKKEQTNADRIRDMTDEEMAEWIAGRYPDCPPGVSPAPLGCDDVCAECWLDWLKKEAENA